MKPFNGGDTDELKLIKKNLIYKLFACKSCIYIYIYIYREREREGGREREMWDFILNNPQELIWCKRRPKYFFLNLKDKLLGWITETDDSQSKKVFNKASLESQYNESKILPIIKSNVSLWKERHQNIIFISQKKVVCT